MTLPELFANTPTPGRARTDHPAERPAGATRHDDRHRRVRPGPLQATGQFRVLVESEYMLVTGGAATTTWTVTRGIEGSAAAAHAAGTAVTHLLTAGALAEPLRGVGPLRVGRHLHRSAEACSRTRRRRSR